MHHHEFLIELPDKAQRERLAMLIEECAEVQQIATKILRHGYGNHHPDNHEQDNRTLLEEELMDLMAVMVLMQHSKSRGETISDKTGRRESIGDIRQYNETELTARLAQRVIKKLKWTRFQEGHPLGPAPF